MTPQPNYFGNFSQKFNSPLSTSLMSNSRKPLSGLNNYVVLKSFKEGAMVIPYDRIVRIEAQKSYSMFYFADGQRFFSSHNLSYHSKQLDTRFFQRIHKSHIINLSQIKEIITDKVKKVVLQDGSSVEVSRRKASGFLRMFRLLSASLA